jgi:hypothetical protein
VETVGASRKVLKEESIEGLGIKVKGAENDLKMIEQAEGNALTAARFKTER